MRILFELNQTKEYLQAELGGEWLTPQKATQMGIPTAMKKLISALIKNMT